jgi:hypothetical protein
MVGSEEPEDCAHMSLNRSFWDQASIYRLLFFHNTHSLVVVPPPGARKVIQVM